MYTPSFPPLGNLPTFFPNKNTKRNEERTITQEPQGPPSSTVNQPEDTPTEEQTNQNPITLKDKRKPTGNIHKQKKKHSPPATSNH